MKAGERLVGRILVFILLFTQVFTNISYGKGSTGTDGLLVDLQGGETRKIEENQEENLDDLEPRLDSDLVNKKEKIQVFNEEELRDALESTSDVDREIVLMQDIDTKDKVLTVNGSSENILIRGNEDIPVTWDEEGNYKSGVKLNISDGRQIGINLKGGQIKLENLVLDGSGESLILYRNEEQDGNKKTILNNVLIQNGKRKLNGTAIRSNISTHINNSCISNNKSSAGSSVYFFDTKINDENKFMINNTQFIKNEGSNGGAIYTSKVKLEMADLKFIENISKCGGAIYQAGGNLQISTTDFLNNQSTYNNGGVLYSKEAPSIYISGSNFLGNRSGYYGGAIALETDGKLNLVNNSFKDNRTEIDPSTGNDDLYGGAIFAYKNNIIEVDGSQFISNISDKDNAISASISNKINIKNSSFNNHNHGGETLSGVNTGGVIGTYSGSELNIDNCNFANNKSYIGGVIYNNSQKLSIKNSDFNGNSSDIGGGVLFFNGGSHMPSLDIEGTSMINNKSRTMGGAIRLEGSAKTHIKDSNFARNKVESDIGLGGFMNILNFDGNISISSSKFSENIAGNGGAIAISSYNIEKDREKLVNFSNLSFEKNQAKSEGGALHLSTNSHGTIEDGHKYTVNIKDSNFNENQANRGGAIKGDHPGILNIENNNFLDNMCELRGGAIYFKNHYGSENHPMNIHESLFKGNKSKYKGGAISAEEETLLNVIGSKFESNEAERGGAISTTYERQGQLKLGKLLVKDTEFTNNKAVRSTDKLPERTSDKLPLAGGIYVEGYVAELENIIAKGNKTTLPNGQVFGQGGFLYAENNSVLADKGPKTKILIKGGNFQENQAMYGGAVGTGIGFNDPIESLEIKGHAKFKNNRATRVGGALYAYEPGRISADDILKDRVYIDSTVTMEENKCDEFRFIDGFKEDKYKKYKKDLTENIKLTSRSKGSSPFNNYDINMLGYEFLIIHKEPNNKKLVKEEVFAKGDKVFTEYKVNKSFKDIVQEDGYRKTYEYTLKNWDMKTKITEGFYIRDLEEYNIKDSEKEYVIDWDDIIFLGNYDKILIDKELIDPPVDPPVNPPVDPPLKEGFHIAYIEGYEDDTIRPERNLTRHEATIILYRLLDDKIIEENYTSKADFKDIPDDYWGQNYIGTLANIGIIQGYPDGKFKPKDKISRAELARMINYFEGIDKKYEKNLNDINGHWAEKDIYIAIKKGWLKGYPDGSFRPNENIKRAEFVAIVNRVFERNAKLENMLKNVKIFKDLDENKWYYRDMIEASNSHSYKIKDGEKIWTNIK